RSAPHFQTEQLRHEVSDGFGDPEEIKCADARRKKRLMRIAHRRVRQEQSLLLADPLGKFDRAKIEQFIARAGRGAVVARVLWDDWLEQFALRIDLTFHVGPAIDDHIADIAEYLCGAIPSRRELEELGRVVDERRRSFAGYEGGMQNEVLKKRD